MVTSVKTPVKIRIDSTTREELHSLKKVGDTYDDVVLRLLKEWNDPRGIDFMIQPSTRDALVEISQKGESYDAVIRRLIKTEVVAKLELGVPLLQELLDIEKERE